MKRCLTLILLSFLLSACVKTCPPPRAPLSLPHPEPLKMKPLEWYVIAKGPLQGRPMFALTEEGYKSLAENVRDATTFIKLQRVIIEKYKQYYEK